MPLDSLLPLIAGFISATLATMAYVLPRTRSVAARYFAMAATSMAAWSFGAAFLAATSSQADNLQARPDELAFWLGAIQLLGSSSSTSAWVFFTAAHTGRTQWLSGWRRVLVVLPFAITLVAGLTNPWHGLLLAPPTTDGTLSPGPLLIPIVFAGATLGPMGIYWMYLSIVRGPGPMRIARGAAIAIAALTPVVGSIIWTANPAAGGPIGADPVPALFLPLSLVLAYEVLHVGMVDILPSAERQFFLESTDAIIALAPDMSVVEANPSAMGLLPGLALGHQLGNVSGELAKQARFCLSHSFDDTTFEATVNGRSLWGRVRRVADPEFDGCMLLLSDLTRLRAAQKALLDRGRTPEGLPASGGYVKRIDEGGGPT